MAAQRASTSSAITVAAKEGIFKLFPVFPVP
jgi:hypothetical protein